jgi:hypothetical protein
MMLTATSFDNEDVHQAIGHDAHRNLSRYGTIIENTTGIMDTLLQQHHRSLTVADVA